jgi:Membrane-bound serine protease (ClpP class)
VNRRVLIILILTIFILIFLSNNAKAQQSNSIIVLNLNMQIDPGSDKFISDGLAYAQANGYNVVVIQMNTPGGFLNSMLNIVNNIQAAESKGIKIYTYVPPGGLAASAGSYIAMATEGIYMARGTEIGPSTPIVVGGTQLEQQHVQNAMLALMEGLAQKYGRNVTAVIPMVTNNTAYSAETAYKIHVIEGIADNFNQFLSLINMTNAQVTILNPSFYDQFLSVISNPTVEGLFITIGLLAILLDIYHPTILLTVIGIILISIGLYGAQLIQASILAIILL